MSPNKTGIMMGIRVCAVVFSAFWVRDVVAKDNAPKPPRGERLVALAKEFIDAGMLLDEVGLTNAEREFLRAIETGAEFEKDLIGALDEEQRNAFAEKWKEAQDRHADDENQWKKDRAEYEQELKEWKENRKTNAAIKAPVPPLIPIRPHKYQVLEGYISEDETAQWPLEATLRGELITWLGTEPEAIELISRPRILIIGCRITGTIRWEFVDLPWSLECYRCDFENAPLLIQAKLKRLILNGSLVPGISADGINVKGAVRLNEKFHSRGAVWLLGAIIGGSLECQGATMESENEPALVADRMDVDGGVFLSENFHSRGQVRLSGATIGGSLSCIGATMENENENRNTLNAEGINVNGTDFLQDFHSHGEVRLLNANIGGHLDCQGATMENPGESALNADGINVKQSVFLWSGFYAAGKISLVRARMGAFHWYAIRKPADAILDLRQAKAGTIWIGMKRPADSTEDLPEAENLYLDGFTYDSIIEYMPDDADWWIDFIKRQPNFLPQPYKQAARVLKEAGHTEEAALVLIAMENRRRSTLGWPMKVWSYACERLIGHGHKPERAIWAAAVVIIIGWLVFWWGYGKVRIVAVEGWAYRDEKKPDPKAKTPGELVFNYPRFSALIYSIDVFIPLVNLKQADHWIPRSRTLQMTWMRVQTSAGWIVMTLLAAGLTGLVGG